MRNYQEALQLIMETGVDKPNRTGIDTRGVFGIPLRFNLQDGFPILTTKRVPFKIVAGELLAFIRGYDNISQFHELGVHIWDANAEAPYWKKHARKEGDLGRIYGPQWNRWRGVKPVKTLAGDAPPGEALVPVEFNQLAHLITMLRGNPNDRRMIVTAWNPAEIFMEKMCLPACHVLFQCYVANGRLSLMMYQRSCDMFLGVPFNIASYALLTHILAKQAGYEPGELIIMLADAHIYHNHFEHVQELLSREPRPLPTLEIHDRSQGLWDYDVGDFNLENYTPHPSISAPMAV